MDTFSISRVLPPRSLPHDTVNRLLPKIHHNLAFVCKSTRWASLKRNEQCGGTILFESQTRIFLLVWQQLRPQVLRRKLFYQFSKK